VTDAGTARSRPDGLPAEAMGGKRTRRTIAKDRASDPPSPLLGLRRGLRRRSRRSTARSVSIPSGAKADGAPDTPRQARGALSLSKGRIRTCGLRLRRSKPVKAQELLWHVGPCQHRAGAVEHPPSCATGVAAVYRRGAIACVAPGRSRLRFDLTFRRDFLQARCGGDRR